MNTLKKIGLWVLGLSLATLTAYGLFALLRDIWLEPDIPPVLRLAIIGFVVGLLVVLAALVVERIKDANQEKEL